MNRLTADKPRDNSETVLNLFYIKDHETWVRGGGPAPDYPDVSLCDYTREIIKTHDLEIDTSDNEAMSDHIAETLFDGIDTAEGVVATLYTAAWAFSELRHRLKMYEDILFAEDGTELISLEQLRAITAPPPNPLLTKKELWGMDGEPVWNDTMHEWMLVDALGFFPKAINSSGKWRSLDDRYYRRKPEEG